MLIESDLVTPSTRRALRARIKTPAVAEPRFFGRTDFDTLCAVCDRMIPQPERPRPIDLAGMLDTHLARGAGDGWRYAHMPPDPILHAAGIKGIDQAAVAKFDRAFARLTDGEADAVLRAVQCGTAPGSIWLDIDSWRYFEELLALLVEIYYAHPLASEEIGYVGMADAHGWQAIGLGERDDHEPVATAMDAAA
jgi:hypothetical protein